MYTFMTLNELQTHMTPIF